MVLTCIIGGIGTVTGPLIGAAVLALLSEALRTSLAQAHLLVYGILVIVVILTMPDGLVGFAVPAAAQEGGSAMTALLEVRNVSKYFGGCAPTTTHLLRRAGDGLRPDRPQRRGEDDALQLHHRLLPAHPGDVFFDGKRINGLPAGQGLQAGDGAYLAEGAALREAHGAGEHPWWAAFSAPTRVAQAREIAFRAAPVVGWRSRAGVLAGGLPIGERKKLELARVMATKPRMILLDEVMGA